MPSVSTVFVVVFSFVLIGAALLLAGVLVLVGLVNGDVVLFAGVPYGEYLSLGAGLVLVFVGSHVLFAGIDSLIRLIRR